MLADPVPATVVMVTLAAVTTVLYPPLGIAALAMFAVIAVVNAPVFVMNAHSASDALAIFASVPIFALLAGLTIFCSLVAFLMMNRWQPHMDATTAGIIYCAEPLYATVFALFLPGILACALGLSGVANETMTPHLILGGSLITVANLLIAWNPRWPSPSA
jgi:drug/metabolite transporter (DMT)-like permease